MEGIHFPKVFRTPNQITLVEKDSIILPIHAQMYLPMCLLILMVSHNHSGLQDFVSDHNSCRYIPECIVCFSHYLEKYLQIFIVSYNWQNGLFLPEAVTLLSCVIGADTYK